VVGTEKKKREGPWDEVIRSLMHHEMEVDFQSQRNVRTREVRDRTGGTRLAGGREVDMKGDWEAR